jgi:hypothetical protein
MQNFARRNKMNIIWIAFKATLGYILAGLTFTLFILGLVMFFIYIKGQRYGRDQGHGNGHSQEYSMMYKKMKGD